MTDHQVPRRTVIGAGLGLGAGLVTGVTQAQAQPSVRTATVTGKKIGFLNSMTRADFERLGLMDAFRRCAFSKSCGQQSRSIDDPNSLHDRP
jgi:hypothetical protein